MNKSETVSTDVLIVGGGPSGLATAIHLADILKKNNLNRRIMVVDKGASIGSHILSGAIVKPEVFAELLPDVQPGEIPFNAKVSRSSIVLLGKNGGFRLPFHPPRMGNKGNYTASLGELCRFLAAKAEEKGVEVYPGFAMNEILYDSEGRVCGAKAIDTGVDHEGTHMENFQPGTVVEAKLTIFAEGTRGSLAKKLIERFNLQEGRNPQVYSLGCKELWSVPEGRIKPGEIYHTMGYPLNMKEFGGGFIYGLNDNRAAVGMVVGLDYPDPTFDVYCALQAWKHNKKVRSILEGGKLIEYGAKTLPEGGYYSIPKLYADGALIVGDSAGFLAMPALKGVHLAVASGMLAAQTAAEAFAAGDFTEKTLAAYQTKVEASRIRKELWPVRNFRQGFAKGLIRGAVSFATQIVTGGAGLCGRLKAHEDKDTTKTLAAFRGKTFMQRFADRMDFDKVLTMDKATDIYYSGVAHDEQQKCHLVVNDPANYVPVNIEQYGSPCQYYCSAEVYEVHTDRDGKKELRIHFENCLHCKTCDIKEPAAGITWNVPYGGNGPDYQNM